MGGTAMTFQQLKNRMGYRKSESKEKCCATCKFINVLYYARKYYKCLKIGGVSPASDVRKSYVCNLWKEEEK
jgi:hypothetical protein